MGLGGAFRFSRRAVCGPSAGVLGVPFFIEDRKEALGAFGSVFRIAARLREQRLMTGPDLDAQAKAILTQHTPKGANGPVREDD